VPATSNVTDDALIVEPEGADKLWALKNLVNARNLAYA
jgi:hypothetical protein